MHEILIQFEFSHVCSGKSKGILAYLLVFQVRAVKNSKLPFADTTLHSSFQFVCLCFVGLLNAEALFVFCFPRKPKSCCSNFPALLSSG